MKEDTKRILKDYKALVEDAIESHMKDEPDYMYGPLRDLFSRGGKRIRPVLCLLSCEAVGGKKEDALNTASALEMVHNFSLIHDDIMDKSDLRRGKPCLNHIYGDALSINAGDGLFALGYKALSRNADIMDANTSLEVFKIFSQTVLSVCEGQAMDVGWTANNFWDIGEKDYILMMSKKTGDLLSASCSTGAVIGQGTKDQVKTLRDFGLFTGKAFQIQDDLLNITGDEEKYGKEIGGDINEGKRTLMVIDTLQKCAPSEKKRLVSLLDKDSNTKDEIKEVISLLEKYGGVEKARKMASEMTDSAFKSLEKLPDTPQKEALFDLAEYVLKREE